MKKLLFTILLSPLLSAAQNNIPRFENDTLYTSGGYKIYKGQTLQFGGGTSAAGYFKYLRFHSNMARTDTYILQNSTVLVEKVRNFKYSGNDNYNIRISGTASLKDGKKIPVDFTMEFEKAISGSDGLAAEMIVPAEYKTRPAVTATIKQQPSTDETKSENIAVDHKAEVKKLSEDWMIAVKKRDKKKLDQIVAPEFTLGGTDFENPAISRELWMKNSMENLKIDSAQYINMQVEVIDNIAIVQSVFYWSVTFMEYPTRKETINLVDTWMKRKGEWQVVNRIVVKK